MDFEMMTNSQYSFSRALAQTNLNFDDFDDASEKSVFVTESYNITKAFVDVNNTIVISTDLLGAGFSFTDYADNIAVSLNSREGLSNITNEGHFFNGDNVTTSIDANGFVEFPFNPFLNDNPEPNESLELGAELYGKLSLLLNRSVQNSLSTYLSYTSDKAHTGKTSMKVTGTVFRDQPMFKLKAAKEYVVSMWVSRENENVEDFSPESLVKIGSNDGSGGFDDAAGTLITVPKITKSKVIEGLQKIDFEFRAISENQIIAFQFLPGA